MENLLQNIFLMISVMVHILFLYFLYISIGLSGFIIYTITVITIIALNESLPTHFLTCKKCGRSEEFCGGCDE